MLNLEQYFSEEGQWVVSMAPSNIALIKYMGKIDSTLNKPTNSSISWTLAKLKTYVRLQKINEGPSKWSALKHDSLYEISLSEKGLKKFLDHFSFLKSHMGISGDYHIQSANNFPSDCGLASSASSFAALTMATYQLAKKNNPSFNLSPSDLAKLSQKGSGSSCRSFFSPWSIWSAQSVSDVKLPYMNLKHLVILCDENIKTVSSSDAHKRVTTSDMFLGRPERAEARLKDLINSLEHKNWNEAVDICWNEFWDMHVLFHTSKPAFQYMNEKCFSVLTQLNNLKNLNHVSPLITMDAGSNIHLLFNEQQGELYQKYVNMFRQQHNLWTDEGYLKTNE